MLLLRVATAEETQAMAKDFVVINGRSINRRHSAYSEWTGAMDSPHGVYPDRAVVERSIPPYSGAGRVGSLELEGAARADLWRFIHGGDSP
jgi:hypothetical protein